ncbi:MAG TPA: rod shape-determining protein MreD [Elusimicrobia bacterium]|nr:rod shape-determining protein MreD [Elusimicrobiota bacterium]HBT62442.1 rod shape-determining protein MreD [Elusimicrobiota bacterium]
MNILRGLLLFWAAVFLQWWWSTRLVFWGLSPQLLLVLTVAIAARRGSTAAMCYGFAWGLFLDVLRPVLFGGNAFVLMLVGYATGTLRRQIDVGDIVSQCAVTFIMTWAYFLSYGLVGMVFAKEFLWAGWGVFVFDPFYNCLLVPVAVVLSDWVRSRP